MRSLVFAVYVASAGCGPALVHGPARGGQLAAPVAQDSLPDPNLPAEEAIAALEDFIARNPSDPSIQEARFRLGHAYFQVEAVEWLDQVIGSDVDPGIRHDNSRRVWQAYLEVQGEYAPTPDQRVRVLYLLGRCHESERNLAEALSLWRSAVCPAWQLTRTYTHCEPLDGGAATGDIWSQLGVHHSQAHEWPLATQAFQHAQRYGSAEVQRDVLFRLALAYVEQGMHQNALDYFARSLEGHPQGFELNHSIESSGEILASPDWNVDSTPDGESALSRCIGYARVHSNLSAMPQVILAAVGNLVAQSRYIEAEQVLSISQQYPDRFDRSAVQRLIQEIEPHLP